MRTFKLAASMLLIAVTIAFVFSSCKKEDDEDEGKLPNISFKTGAGYTSANATMAAGTTFKVGIDASKAEEEDVLMSFSGTYNFNGGTEMAIPGVSPVVLTGAQGDSYSTDVNITTGATAGKENYSFQVVNRDGLINSVKLTITVN